MGDIKVFKEDLLLSLNIRENISGCKVKVYRAPKWSIFDLDYLAALQGLHVAGLVYDSSVFPKMGGGGVRVFSHQVDLSGGAKLWKVPATTYPFFCLRLPVAGGLCFRFFPSWVTHKALLSCQGNAQPSVIYLHPYDLDASCPRLPGGNPLFQWIRYYGVDTAFDRLKVLLHHYKFVKMLDWVQSNHGGAGPSPTKA